MLSKLKFWRDPPSLESMSLDELSRAIHMKREQLWAEAYRLPDNDPDDLDWKRTDIRNIETDAERIEVLREVREAVKYNPYCFRALRLYSMYCFGAEFKPIVKPLPVFADLTDDEDRRQRHFTINQLAEKIFREFAQENHGCWSPDEMGRRTWRDGEQFTLLFQDTYPLKVRFIDPEEIGDSGGEDNEGIVCSLTDVCDVIEYIRVEPETSKEVTRYPADRVIHTKIDADTTEKRGNSRFVPALTIVKKFEHFLDTEVRLRNLQASIAVVRKVQGGGTSARTFLNNQKDSNYQDGSYSVDRERFYPGTLLTHSKNVDIEFKQPNTAFSDASPLAAMMAKQIAAVMGWTYSMLTQDTGEGNLANSIVQESPVHQMVMEERNHIRPDLIRVYRAAIEAAFTDMQIASEFATLGFSEPEDFWNEYQIDFKYGTVVSRDPLKDAQTMNLAVMMGACSRAEASRALGFDPEQMARERLEEVDRPDINPNYANQNPDQSDMQASSQSNAQAGGQNQGDGGPIQHSDNAGVGASQNT